MELEGKGKDARIFFNEYNEENFIGEESIPIYDVPDAVAELNARFIVAMEKQRYRQEQERLEKEGALESEDINEVEPEDPEDLEEFVLTSIKTANIIKLADGKALAARLTGHLEPTSVEQLNEEWAALNVKDDQEGPSFLTDEDFEEFRLAELMAQPDKEENL